MRVNGFLLLAGSAFLVAVIVVACSSGGGGGRFLFTAGDADMGAFTINSGTGAVTAVAGSPFATGFSAFPCPDHSAATPSGKFLYVADECNDNVAGFAIDTTGKLTPLTGSPFATTTGNFDVVQPVVHPNGKFLFVPEDIAGDVVVYSIGTDGKLTPIAGSPFLAGGEDQSGAISADGKFLYVADGNSPPGPPVPSITVFSIDSATGKLTQVTGSPFAVGGTDPPSWIVVHPSGKFAYATAPSETAVNGSVLGGKIDTTTGGFTAAIAGSPFPAGPNPAGLDVSPNGKFLFVANNADRDVPTTGSVSAYTIDSSTGALTAVAGSPFTAGPNPKHLRVSPSSNFLYVTNEDTDNMSVFSINSSTGVLTQVAGSPFKTNVGSEGITIVK